MRRAVVIASLVIALWLVALVILDATLEARQVSRVTDQLGESLHAQATVGAADLALVRGRMELHQLAVKRDDLVGHLTIDVADVRCELGPLGWALVDSGCRELALRGVRMEVSTAALFKLANPKRRPIHARRLVIDDAVLAFSPSAFLPSLGKVEIAIDHAESGPTVLRTPLSWLFTLDELGARIELPAGISVRLAYDHGVLSAAGTLFGSATVKVPVTLPAAETAHDAHGEIQLLVKLGEDVAERLVAQRAEDWLRSLRGSDSTCSTCGR